MARTAVSDGIETIIATPHTLNRTYTNPCLRVAGCVERMSLLLSREEIPLTLLPGSDAHVSPNMVERVEAGDAGTINGNGRYLLVELPHQWIPPGAEEELFQLRIRRITPIISHPERNLAIQGHLEILQRLVDSGCLAQVTAMSVTGEFGEDAMVSAHRMLEDRLVHIIASDAHAAISRPPILSRAVEAAAHILGSWKEALEMVQERPAAIIAGEDIVLETPHRRKKRGLLSLFGRVFR